MSSPGYPGGTGSSARDPNAQIVTASAAARSLAQQGNSPVAAECPPSHSRGGFGADGPSGPRSSAVQVTIHDQLVAAMQAADALDAALMAEVQAGRSNLRHAQRVKRDMTAAIRSLAYLQTHGAAIKSAVAYMREQPDLVRKFADAGAEIYAEHLLEDAPTTESERVTGRAAGVNEQPLVEPTKTEERRRSAPQAREATARTVSGQPAPTRDSAVGPTNDQ